MKKILIGSAVVIPILIVVAIFLYQVWVSYQKSDQIFQAERFWALGNHYEDIGKYSEADSIFKDALATYEKAYGNKDPRVTEIQNQLILVQELERHPEVSNNIVQGSLSTIHGEYQQAIDLFSKVIQSYPKYNRAYMQRAYAYNQLKLYQREIDDCSKAIELDPMNDIAPYYGRAFAYNKLKEYQMAIDDYNKVISLHQDAEAYVCRASSYDYLGQHQKAMGDYIKAISLDPLYPNDYWYRAIAYEKLGKLDLAEQNSKKAKELGYSAKYK
jgi:tetratricopeptide (TPR) repeat protein